MDKEELLKQFKKKLGFKEFRDPVPMESLNLQEVLNRYTMPEEQKATLTNPHFIKKRFPREQKATQLHKSVHNGDSVVPRVLSSEKTGNPSIQPPPRSLKGYRGTFLRPKSQ